MTYTGEEIRDLRKSKRNIRGSGGVLNCIMSIWYI